VDYALLTVIVLAGIASVAHGSYRLWRLRAISYWPSVKATVRSAEFTNISRGGDDPPQFRPRLKYEYSVQGKVFQSAALGISVAAFDFHSEKELKDFMAKAAPGCQVDVLVNPVAPHDAFLAPGASGMRRNHYAAVAASGVLVLLAAAGAWWLMHA